MSITATTPITIMLTLISTMIFIISSIILYRKEITIKNQKDLILYLMPLYLTPWIKLLGYIFEKEKLFVFYLSKTTNGVSIYHNELSTSISLIIIANITFIYMILKYKTNELSRNNIFYL